MKKHLSVFMLMVGSSFYWVLLLLLGMALVEGGLFYRVMQNLDVNATHWGLEYFLNQAGLKWVFALALIELTAILHWPFQEAATKQGYTLARLSISGRWVFFWHSLYNFCCYLLLLAVQILLAWAICQYYMYLNPLGTVTGQTMLLAFYRSDFFHVIMPLNHLGIWIRNILALLALSVSLAWRPGYHSQRATLAMVILILLLGRKGLGSVAPSIFMIAGSAAVLFYNIHRVVFREEAYED